MSGPTRARSPNCSAETVEPTTHRQVTCGAGTTLVGAVCTIDATPPPVPVFTAADSVCQQGTKLEAAGCVPDCTDLRRRSVDCPSCGDTANPGIPRATTDSGSEGAGSGVIIGVVAGVALLLTGVGVVAWRRSKIEPTPEGAPRSGLGIENPLYEQPGNTDGFGFGANEANQGYLEVGGTQAER